MLKILDKLAKCTQMYRYSCRKRKSLTFLFYRILTWDRERCAQLAETKRTVANFPENDELLCVENFGQVDVLYMKMYSKCLSTRKNQLFCLTEFGPGTDTVVLSSPRRIQRYPICKDWTNFRTLPPSDRLFQIGP